LQIPLFLHEYGKTRSRPHALQRSRKKTPRQHTAIEELAKLPLHEDREMAIPLALPGEKGFQVSGDGGIEGAVFRASSTIYRFNSHAADTGNPGRNRDVVVFSNFRVPER
jgi:hypothetical protein